MKKVLFVTIAITALFISKANAQREDKQFSFGFGVEGGPMLGDKNFKNDFSSEFGLSFRFSYKAGPGYATFTPGGLLVLPKKIGENADNVKVGTHVPLKVGYKFIAGKFFAMAEAGYSFYNLYIVDENTENLNNVPKVKGGGFTYAPSIGANLGVFEIGLRYESTLAKFEGTKITPSMLGLRLGFNF